MMTTDQMINRILGLTSCIEKARPWYTDGITLETGQRVGAPGWKASYGCGQWSAIALTIEEAIQGLLKNVEEAFDADIKEKEQRLAYMRKFNRE